MRAAAVDLLLGSRCAGCELPGAVLCDGCGRRLVARPAPRSPDPPPPLLHAHGVASWSAGTYAGVLRRLVVAYKDGSRPGLVRPLGRLLATTVEHAVACTAPAPLVVELVPVPSSRASSRRRGRDPVGDLVREAASVLRRRGLPARLLPRLALTRRVRDQAGLGADDRADNLHGAMAARPGAARPRAVRVVADDVLTTGVTAQEAVRALVTAGLAVDLVVTVAATPRRAGRASGAGSAGGPPC